MIDLKLNQAILLVGLLVFLVYSFRLRSVLAERIVYVLSFASGTVLVVYPELSIALAQMIGIGRGSDLLMYAFIMFSLFHFARVNAELRRLEAQMTAVIRQGALMTAHPGRDRGLEPSGGASTSTS